MWGRVRTFTLVVAVGAAALVPLFGDPRSTPVTHPLWARMLLRAFDMTDAVRTSATASQVFGTLAWRDSLSLRADQYVRADGAVLRGEREERLVTAEAAPAEAVYALAVVRPGDYLLRARLAGPPIPATAEITSMSGGPMKRSFSLVPAAEPAWVFGGSMHLDPGAYTASFLLPPGCSLSHVEVAPPCLRPIEPAGGWQPREVTTVEDVAVTALQAIDVEHELPPAAVPIELTGHDFQIEGPPEALTQRVAAGDLDVALRAGPRGLRALLVLAIPEDGLYSISAFAIPGAGQRWLADGCRKAVVCPGPAAAWRTVMTQPFAAGRHTLVVTLAEGAVVELVRIEKRKDTPADYVATLRRLGLDPGPDGPVSRAKAIAAMDFVRTKRRAVIEALCEDTVRYDDSPLAMETQVAAEADEFRDQFPPPPPIPPPVADPIAPSLLPPQEVASPTVPGSGGS